MKSKVHQVFIVICFLSFLPCMAFTMSTIPFMVNHQGVITKGGVPVESGEYDMRFVIIDDESVIRWSNDGTHLGQSANTTMPDSPVVLELSGGRYSVKLGDTGLAHMVALPSDVFVVYSPTYLRVWFNKSGEPTQLFSPDIQLVSVPYAYNAYAAEHVPAGSISTENIGRSSSVRSVVFKGSVGGTNQSVYTVPAGKTFVVTDVFVVRSQTYALWGFRDRNSTNDVYLKLLIDSSSEFLYNYHLQLNAGIVFESGSVISVRREVVTTPAEFIFILSGYEF